MMKAINQLIERRSLVFFIVFLMFFQTACTTTVRSSASYQEFGSRFSAGDRVRLHFVDGGTQSVMVIDYSSEGVTAEGGEFYAWNEISRVEKKQFSSSRTIFLGAVVVIAALAIVVITWSSGSDRFMEQAAEEEGFSFF